MYRLRELERRDLEAINQWQNVSYLVALRGAPFKYIVSTTDEKWFEGCATSIICFQCPGGVTA